MRYRNLEEKQNGEEGYRQIEINYVTHIEGQAYIHTYRHTLIEKLPTKN